MSYMLSSHSPPYKHPLVNLGNQCSPFSNPPCDFETQGNYVAALLIYSQYTSVLVQMNFQLYDVENVIDIIIIGVWEDCCKLKTELSGLYSYAKQRLITRTGISREICMCILQLIAICSFEHLTKHTLALELVNSML